MKVKHLLILATSISTIPLLAQRQTGNALAVNPVSGQSNQPATQMVASTDTIGAGFDWSTGTAVIYSVGVANGGGFVTGTNGYGDKQKVQVFDPGQPVVVNGAIYWFGAKTVTTSNSVVNMRIYAIDALGNSTTSPTSTSFDTPCPGTAIVSDAVPLSQVDTSTSLTSAYVHTFSTTPYLGGAFGVGFDISNVQFASGDTLGLVSTSDGEFAQDDYNWEQWSDNNWFSFASAASWEAKFELGIFPIVELGTGVQETPFINGAKLGIVSANPFTDLAQVSYSLSNETKNVTLMLLDATGKVVQTTHLGDQPAGQYLHNIEGANLAAGVYYLALNAGSANIAVKLIKQ
ncbi:MAG: T9SS type A sorting domain-containing protein [Bacteroidetes bacterium]|nr:T9SS type A sorting domain-containing protein [Bacteroidota bacterium]